MKVGGLDLSSKERNPSGVCVYPLKCKTLYSNDEIVKFFSGTDVLAVDAPLSLETPWRDSERELISKGYRPLPLSMESMKLLHERVLRLKKRLICKVIETFVSPMRIPIVEVFQKRMGWNKHERDAFLASLSAKAYVEGKALVFGEEHPIYVAPKEYVEKEVKRLLRTSSP